MDPADEAKGDQWDHTAIDVPSRFIVSLAIGKRNAENLEEVVADFAARTGGAPPALTTTDDCSTYANVLLKQYGVQVVPPRTGKSGRPRKPYKQWPEGAVYATVNKTYRKGRVSVVDRKEAADRTRGKGTWKRAETALRFLDAHNFPAYLWQDHEDVGRLLEATDSFGLGWGVFIDVRAEAVQQVLGTLRDALGVACSSRIVEGQAPWLRGKLKDYRALRPAEGYLRILGLEVGDGRIIAEALREHPAAPRQVGDRNDDGPINRQGQREAEVYLLHHTEGDRPPTTSVFDRTARSALEGPEEDNPALSLLRDTNPGDSLHPRLAWYQRGAQGEWPPCHLAVLGDVFSGTPAVVDGDLPPGQELFGLMLPTGMRYVSSTQTWSRWVAPWPSAGGSEHPAFHGFSRTMGRLQEAWLRRIASLVHEDVAGWPGLRVEMAGRAGDELQRAHRAADWVAILDRHPGIEYYDAPADPVEGSLVPYILDFCGEPATGTTHAMLVSTGHYRQVKTSLETHLRELGLRLSDEGLRCLLWSLQAVSGRYMLRSLQGSPLQGEALAAAALHAYHRRHDLPGFLVPAANHLELFDASLPPCDLVHFFVEKRGRGITVGVQPVVLGPVVDREPDAELLERLSSRIWPAKAEMETVLDAPAGEVPALVRRVQWARTAIFYAERAARHGTLSREELDRVKPRIATLLQDGRAAIECRPGLIAFFTADTREATKSFFGEVLV